MKKKRGNKAKYSTVSLPSPLVDKIKSTIENTGYVSISDFVTDVIRTILVAKKESKSKNSEDKFLTKHEENQIKLRLKTLGYIK